MTTFETDEYVLTAVRNGATGFVLKDAEPADPSGPSEQPRPATPCCRRAGWTLNLIVAELIIRRRRRPAGRR